ncbi:MAG: replicative DNA helicase [Rickettsiales bacterium]|nr:replicative DNA helicase [Rickettsiales bacterium]
MEALPQLVDTDNNSEALSREAPHNIEAEQALLGAILQNNEALHHVVDSLQSEHFYQPLHQKIFHSISLHHEKGMIANAVTLKHGFVQEDGNAGEYLGQLAVSAVSIINVKEYSQLVLDLAKKRELISIGTDVVNEAYVADDERTATEHIEEAEQRLYSLASEGIANKSFAPVSGAVKDAVASAERAFKHSGETVGLPTGLSGLNKLLGGFQNSDLIILAGRPSMGKTALALSMAHHVAKHFEHQHNASGSTAKMPSVGFFSLEMSSEQLAGRLLSSDSGINASDIRRGTFDQDQFGTMVESSHNIARLPLFIDDTPAVSISSMRARARRLKRMHNLSLLVVDYLQLMRGSAKSGDNRVQEVSEITMGLKSIAKELNIPVIALSQLSRQVENRDDKRPQLADLRESGSIEQDADIVMFVYREEYYLMRTMPREEEVDKFMAWQEEMDKIHGLAEVIVSKNRHGGIQNITCAFQAEMARFSDLEKDNY